jgi:predicted nucleotidyltransferase
MRDIPINELEYIAKTLAFYTMVGRALDPEELWYMIPPSKRPNDFEELNDILAMLEETSFIERSGGSCIVRGAHCDNLGEKKPRQKRIAQEKWKKLLTYRKYFDYIPFANFAFVSGSLVFGAAHEDSDFDMVIGARKGRIFTTRFFTLLVFSLLGVRRKSTDSKEKSKNKFCFNHFITPDGYRLMGPHTFTWEQVYQNIVPIYGDEAKVIQFIKANDWVERPMIIFDNRWVPKEGNAVRLILEFLLGGFLGNIFEWKVKKLQMWRINRSRPQNKDARVYASDEELEFHPREPEFREDFEKVTQFLEYLQLT